MFSLLLTLAALIASLIAVQITCWKLFARKMAPLRFPTPEDPNGSHTYWLHRMRAFTFLHTGVLMVFLIVFFFLLW